MFVCCGTPGNNLVSFSL
uniref:Uncharacterized protein n=1 Tax=Rhizophora mucronata TaxID=61149 RepID=A0A2P2M2E3_RHIMU